MLKISIEPKLKVFYRQKSVHNGDEIVTFIRHESALLHAISVLFENILFYMFLALRDLSFLFNLWNLLYRNP